jgi:hypothetical protein
LFVITPVTSIRSNESFLVSIDDGTLEGCLVGVVGYEQFWFLTLEGLRKMESTLRKAAKSTSFICIGESDMKNW